MLNLRNFSNEKKMNSVQSLSNDWSSDIENVLEQIRINSVLMSKEHKTKYLYLKGILRYFRVPVILISSIASVSSVGLQPYIDQQMISVITCLLSLTCGIIGSIELFLAIQSRMENELMASKDYYILSIEIFKVLTLDRENRSMDGKAFLETSYGTYVKLIENSNIIDKKIVDRLAFIDKKNINTQTNINTNASTITKTNDGSQIDENSSDETPSSPKKDFFNIFKYYNNGNTSTKYHNNGNTSAKYNNNGNTLTKYYNNSNILTKSNKSSDNIFPSSIDEMVGMSLKKNKYDKPINKAINDLSYDDIFNKSSYENPYEKSLLGVDSNYLNMNDIFVHVENKHVENKHVENKHVESKHIENNLIESNLIESNLIENNLTENNLTENNLIDLSTNLSTNLNN